MVCSARGGCWLLGHGGPLLPVCNTGVSSAEQESVAGMRQQRAGPQEPAEGKVGSLLADGAVAWAAFVRNQCKDCSEV